MQRRAVAAVFLHVEALKEIRPFRHHAPGFGAKRAKRLDTGAVGQRLVRHIQRHHHKRYAGFEHDISGFRIDVNVEFGRGGDVAHLEIGAAHQHDLLHPGHDIGGLQKGRGDIGQRPKRAQRDGMRRFAPQGFDDEINARADPASGIIGSAQLRAVQPGLAMHMFGRDQLALQGRVAAGKDLVHRVCPPIRR